MPNLHTTLMNPVSQPDSNENEEEYIESFVKGDENTCFQDIIERKEFREAKFSVNKDFLIL